MSATPPNLSNYNATLLQSFKKKEPKQTIDLISDDEIEGEEQEKSTAKIEEKELQIPPSESIEADPAP